MESNAEAQDNPTISPQEAAEAYNLALHYNIIYDRSVKSGKPNIKAQQRALLYLTKIAPHRTVPGVYTELRPQGYGYRIPEPGIGEVDEELIKELERLLETVDDL